MATVSERSRELAATLDGRIRHHIGDGAELWPDAIDIIEQALLAERRLAMEFCAEIADESDEHIAKVIRAAAEKEVSNG